MISSNLPNLSSNFWKRSSTRNEWVTMVKTANASRFWLTDDTLAVEKSSRIKLTFMCYGNEAHF